MILLPTQRTDSVSISSAATSYINGKHVYPTPVERMWFSAWLNEAYAEIVTTVRYTPQEVDPVQLKIRYENTGDILVSTAHNNSPWLDKKENIHFRAVHDWHHLQYNHAFDCAGEYMVFEAASSLAPVQIHWILKSEIWLQAAARHCLGRFPEQKLVRVA